jgi:hypothetical protein
VARRLTAAAAVTFKVAIETLPVGAEVRVMVTAIVSELTPRNDCVIEFVTTVDPVATVDVAEVRVRVSVCVVADEGATEVRRPKPKAATVTSAMRLKVVFVDICFLSISRVRECLALGLNQISLIRFDESHVLIHQILRPISGRSEGISI